MISKSKEPQIYNKSRLAIFLSNYTIVFVILILAVIFSIGNRSFLTTNNIITILRQSSILGVAGIGVMFVMISGNINLALGSTISIVTVIIALLIRDFQYPWLLSMLIALISATLCGLFTGVSIVIGRINAMIGSFAVSIILGGVAYILCGGLPVYGAPQESKIFGQGFVGKIPIPLIILLVVAVLVSFVLNKTYFGRYFFATGSNDEAARLSGINTTSVRVLAYTISGFFAGIAGIVMYGRVGSGQPSAGTDIDMNVLAAAVIGGTSMHGGEGKVFNTLCGCVLMSMLTNGMTLMNINVYVQMCVRGIIFLGAVLFDSYQHRKKPGKVR